MNNPSIDLMEEYSVATVKDLCEHILYNRIPSGTLLIHCVQELPSLKVLLLYLLHNID